jgi:pilus assembly protein Flp/PilA
MLLTLPALVKRDEEGQTLAEYALILALIAVVVIGAVVFLSGKISSIFTNVGNHL